MVSAKTAKRNAFTIVELIVIVVIIGVLSTVTVIGLNSLQKKTSIALVTTNLTIASNQLSQFKMDNGAFPISIDSCPTPTSGNICLNTNDKVSYTYYPDAGPNPNGYTLVAEYDGVSYLITNGNNPVAFIPLNPATPAVAPDSCYTIVGGSVMAYSNSPLCPDNLILSDTVGGQTVTSISSNAFADGGIVAVNIPTTVTTIADGAFQNNAITSVIIPDSVTTIGANAFAGNSISDLSIGCGLTTLGDGSFKDNNLTELSIPLNVTTIGTTAFQNNNITIVRIFKSIVAIADFLFSGLNNNFRDALTAGGKGIYTSSAQTGVWTKATSGLFYNSSKGVNAPQLVCGMTPVKWDGSSWVATTSDDSGWYDYTTKQWANARTADGSFWVWVPRYIYKISTGWHTNAAGGGTVNAQFSMDTDDTRGGTVTIVNAGTSNDSNNSWTNHPAFNFGNGDANDKQLPGMWVAKFEASGADANNISFVPNVAAYTSANISTTFNTTRALETSARYGWGTSGANIDTHVPTNNEWGAAAFLALSTYGANAEVWINPANNSMTGCAGDSVSAASTTGCLRAYDTTNGQKSSTTGNVTGIYGMSGGAWEIVMGVYNNTAKNSGFANPATIENKYINRYSGYSVNDKGSAMYEASSTSTLLSTTSWFGDYSSSISTLFPWVIRGGSPSDTTKAGIIHFRGCIGNSTGVTGGVSGFRSTLLVGDGL